MTYRIEASDNLEHFVPIEFGIRAGDFEATFDLPVDRGVRYYRVRRQ
jgi:hypothetical protein